MVNSFQLTRSARLSLTHQTIAKVAKVGENPELGEGRQPIGLGICALFASFAHFCSNMEFGFASYRPVERARMISRCRLRSRRREQPFNRGIARDPFSARDCETSIFPVEFCRERPNGEK